MSEAQKGSPYEGINASPLDRVDPRLRRYD
jgi:hypothetical protein